MSTYILKKFLALTFVAVFCLLASSAAMASATITIVVDPADQGFNDNTPAQPVGGNNGTTVGQQRMIVFQHAASIWGATLNSSVPIVIRARWVPLDCSGNGVVLASAGTNGIVSDFPNAPFPGTWYPYALANALAGSDQNGSEPEINLGMNISLGGASCSQTAPWYLGLDGAHGGSPDAATVLLHEMGHGLGFQSFVSSTGTVAQGLASLWDRFLRDNVSGKLWINMTAAEKSASSRNGNLVWNGPQVTAASPSVLGTPRLRINSPSSNQFEVGTADFGPSLTSPGITGSVVRAQGPGNSTDGCSALTNAGSISGNIAFIDRGTCNFIDKVKNAQDAGATGVIIGNVAGSNNENVPPIMGAAGPPVLISIPSLSLSRPNADTLRTQLNSSLVNGTLLLDHSVLSGADSSNRVLMYAPATFSSGSSVSHFDESAYVNLLMEPNDTGDLTQTVGPPKDLTFLLLKDIGWTGSLVGTTPSIQFAASTSSAAESAGSLSINVTRTGDTSGTSTVDFATSDASGNNGCNIVNGAANSRCDYLKTLGKLTFAAGETSKTISIPIIDDVFVEGGGEAFTVTLSNVTGATLGQSTNTVTITDNGNDVGGAANPIDNSNFFVRQHYIDFLNREPDGPGLDFWVEQIESCGANAACREVRRVNVSAAFFLSIEFQETGYLVYRFYKAAFSNLSNPPGAPVPIVFSDFLRDTQEIRKGVEVGVGNWQAQLEANKQAYALAFVQRADFLSQYPNSMSATDFVTQLNNRSGGALSPSEQTTQINILGATPADLSKRAQVLRNVAEDQTLKDAEFNKAFVLMQYFGYMRRSPNDFPDSNFNGFDFWFQKLNENNGNFIQAEMVKAFITSIEYRNRFAP